ncbi:MAG: hypothetical protein Q9218_007622 [Villophora microphyllina]
MLFSLLLILLAAVNLSHARRGPRLHGRGSLPLVNHGMFPSRQPEPQHGNERRAPVERRQGPGSTGCGSSSQLSVKAPKSNIFAGLTNDEAAAVTSFLHDQKDLNLTAASNATSWDNKILTVELLQPNKSDAISYLDSTSQAPVRQARAILRFGATLEPYLQEYVVGPLPVAAGKTTVAPLDYIFNKGRGYQRLYNVDIDALTAFAYGYAAANISDISQQLLNGTATGDPSGTFAIAGTTPLIFEGDRVLQWNQLYMLHTGACEDEDILPSGLMFKTDITGRDPSKWSVVALQYNGIFYESEADFRKAINASGFIKPGTNVDGAWACTDYNNVSFPHDELNPPVSVTPDGSRFTVDVEEKYVEWSTYKKPPSTLSIVMWLTKCAVDFTFYLSSSKYLGTQLHNIKYKGERIIYELGIQEAMAHYASASDPFQASNAYLDSEYGFGQTGWQLVSGFDCPAYATYLNTSYYTGETTHTHPNSICLFEYDPGYPIQRHTASSYVSVTKNIVFTVRSISTVGNYDYLFDYEFYLDGSIHVTVRASGYIESSFWASTTQGNDGFHIHDHLDGSMHDHVLNYKVDLDVAGTANSVVKAELVPVSKVYPWSNGREINTMTLDRTFLASEDEGKLNWDVNNAVMYSVINKDAVNPYGEYRSYKIMPATANRNHLTIQNSTTLGKSANWATHHLYAVQRKDTEPNSAYPYNGRDPNNPVVDFAKFFDGESLDQEDIVM